MTTEVVTAYTAKNHVQPSELPALIASVHDAFRGLGKPSLAEAVAEPPKPAVPVNKSVTDELIISLEDGRKFRSMKRYLSTLGMTPADYRAKWGLPADYPMVAPAYAAKRSEIAKARFGRNTTETLPQPDEMLESAPGLEMRKPGRPKNASA
ncbi:MAG: MucR family transcriptional regulator [Janthinobacterium lividum]